MIEMAGYEMVVPHRDQKRFLLRADGFPARAPGMEAAAGRDV